MDRPTKDLLNNRKCRRKRDRENAVFLFRRDRLPWHTVGLAMAGQAALALLRRYRPKSVHTHEMPKTRVKRTQLFAVVLQHQPRDRAALFADRQGELVIFE